MTKPKLTPDQLEDHLMDIEGELRHQRALALTMLFRFSRRWRIEVSDGVWWWLRPALCAADDSTPPMQLTADEQALWTALLCPNGVEP